MKFGRIQNLLICKKCVSIKHSVLLTHMHKQCESMEWRKRRAGRPCTELLAPTIFHTSKHWYQYTYLGLYLFFDGAAIFWKNISFLPQNKKTLS